MSSSLCQHCSRISIDRITDPSGYRHQPTVWALSLEQRHCPGCAEIFEQVRATARKVIEEDEQWMRSHFVLLRYVRAQPIKLKIEIFAHGAETLVATSLTYHMTENGSAKHYGNSHGELRLFTDEGDIAERWSIPGRRLLPSNTASEASFTQLRKWIANCNDHDSKPHEDPVTNNKLDISGPARLLKLCGTNSGSSLQVVPTSSTEEPFVALSYVWGSGPAPWKTTKANLPQRLQGMDITELPATLRDACKITHELGLRHLWIDAICIVQDDDADWAREAAKMHKVYAQAYLTVAACASENSRAGLFNTVSCDQSHDMKLFVTATNQVADGSMSTLHMCNDWRECQWDQFMEAGVWRSRAWTCQERILSPRIVYYSNTQLFWQCLHCIESEDNFGAFLGHPGGQHAVELGAWRNLFFGMTPKRRYRRWSDPDKWQEHQHPDDPIEIIDLTLTWDRGVVEGDYSSRSLSFGRDKLVAISSLARMVQTYRPSPYYAGMWGDCLLESISWARNGRGRKSTEYRAPSWAWASQDSAVAYRDMVVSGAIFDCRLESVETKLATDDPFGRVSDGLLLIDARIFTGTIGPVIEQEPPIVDNTGEYEFTLDNGARGYAILDDDELKVQQVTAALLRFDFIGHYFLLLQRRPSGEWIRIGIAQTYGWRPSNQVVPDFDYAPRQSFRIR